jgi:hypothetical protein
LSAITKIKLLSMLGRETSRGLLTVIDRELNDGRLEEIRTHFCRVWHERWQNEATVRLICFYETMKTNLTKVALPRWARVLGVAMRAISSARLSVLVCIWCPHSLLANVLIKRILCRVDG